MAQKDWEHAFPAWEKYCEEAPFGLSGGEASWANFRRRHGAALEAAGVIRRVGKSHFVDTRRMKEAYTACLVGDPIPPEAATKARAVQAADISA